MLDLDYEAKLKLLLTKVPCLVQVPDDWKQRLSQTGVYPSFDGDSRRYVRRRLPGNALLETTGTLPAVVREKQVAVVYTRDISRGGISFLHHEQMYPCELANIWLAEGKQTMEVVRCNYVGPNCYQVSGQFVA